MQKHGSDTFIIVIIADFDKVCANFFLAEILYWWVYTVLIKQKGATANDKQKSNRPVGAAVGRRFDDRLRHLAWGGRYGVVIVTYFLKKVYQIMSNIHLSVLSMIHYTNVGNTFYDVVLKRYFDPCIILYKIYLFYNFFVVYLFI